MLGELEAKSGRLVVADLEAGVGTVSRLDGNHVDRLILVVEPYAKSLETGRRALKIAGDVGIQEVLVVASRVTEEQDVARVAEMLPGQPVLAVPDDPAVMEADRIGAAPIDHSPDSPAMTAIAGVADALLEPATARDGERRGAQA